MCVLISGGVLSPGLSASLQLRGIESRTNTFDVVQRAAVLSHDREGTNPPEYSRRAGGGGGRGGGGGGNSAITFSITVKTMRDTINQSAAFHALRY